MPSSHSFAPNKRVTVYRVEDSGGNGPYAGSEDKAWMEHGPHYHNGKDRPAPHEDGLPRIAKGHLCAFTNKKDVRQWFGYRGTVDLHNFGYHVAVYRIPSRRVLVGTKQCLFERKQAKPVRTVNVLTFTGLPV